ARGVGLPACQQFGGRAEHFGLQADVSEETVKRLSQRDIVVDDEDNRVLRTARQRRTNVVPRPVPDHALSLRCEARSLRSTAASEAWVERPLEGSSSDGAIIPGPARCLLDGFDPAGTLLLFSCRNQISGRFTPIRGELGVWPFRAWPPAALGGGRRAPSIR